MALVVQKFGGTSVGSIERIENVARRVLDRQQAGDQVVLVVSAMSGETNRLDSLAREIQPVPDSRDYDLLLASGEQASAGLVSMAINAEAQRRGLIQAGEVRSKGLLGFQIGILTDSVFSKARIQQIDTSLLRKEIENNVIPVIAGFQGVDVDRNITTLGRGGSDTSAVAIAAALGADECEIYTDVDGVYTTDPRLYRGARKIEKISYEEMMELASLGAKVLQIRSVELAAKVGLVLHVRSSFEKTEGTKVVPIESLGSSMEQVVVSGVAADKDQVKLTLQNVPDQPGVAGEIFGALSQAAVVVDVIVLDISASGMLTVSFTVGEKDFALAQKTLDQIKTGDSQGRFSEMSLSDERNLAKVSIVGVGMQHHPGVASKMFQLLAQEKINIKLITTSEIKVSCLVEASQVAEAVACLHKGFELDRVH